MPNTEQSIAETGGVPEITLEVEVFGMTQTPTDKTLTIPDMPADAKTVGDKVDELEEKIEEVLLDFYPIGSIYMTVSNEAPTFLGEWVEIAITATIAQLKNGKRGYNILPAPEVGDDVHFWLRVA